MMTSTRLADWLARWTLRPAASAPAGQQGLSGIRQQTLNAFVQSAPAPEHAIAIFASEWASMFPPPFDHLSGGRAPLFDDVRIRWAIAELGGIGGRRILELGPLEGGHSYMLDRGGATHVLSIEGNTRAYLKCLIAKELLGMPAVHFVCGDFTEYLRSTSERFDVAFASGVLYHMTNPVQLVDQLSRVAPRLFLWTHYYDEALLARNPATAHRVLAPIPSEHGGFAHRLYRHDYGQALDTSAFCGGNRPGSYWLSRTDIEGALRHFGFADLRIAHEHPDHPNGPAFSILAQR